MRVRLHRAGLRISQDDRNMDLIFGLKSGRSWMIEHICPDLRASFIESTALDHLGVGSFQDDW